MRNLLLAITSFFATVLIFSQVALAQSANDGDPKHTTAAQGEDPNLARTSENDMTEAGVPNAGNKCKDGTCFTRSVGGRLSDNTVARPGGKSGTSSGTGQGQEGAQ